MLTYLQLYNTYFIIYFLLQKRLGANKITMPNAFEFRSAYALVGFSGPPEVTKDVHWIREELSEPSKGPSVISIVVPAGKHNVINLKI